MNRIAIAACAVAAAALTGCGPTQEEQARKLTQLSSLTTCAEVEKEVRATLKEQINREIDANKDMAMGSVGCWAFGARSAGVAPMEEGGGGTGASQYSTTNNQVVGVDEADIVKNDAQHIYALGEGKLNIIRAWPPADARVLSRTPIQGTPKKLFVEKGRAVVLSSLGVNNGLGGWDSRECTYGYDCDFTGDGRPLLVSIYDLSDLTAPRLVRETRFSGSLVTSRRIGDAVHLVVNAPGGAAALGLRTWAPTVGGCGLIAVFDKIGINAAFEELRAENMRRIDALKISDILPSVTDVRHTASGQETDPSVLSACQNFFASGSRDGAAFLSVASFDLTKEDPVRVTTIVGRPGPVYASAESLYVATRHEYLGSGAWFTLSPQRSDEMSTVHRFGLLGAGSSYLGSGLVKGRVLNQFSMDEYDGRLRIATTVGHSPSPGSYSAVSVMMEGARGGLEVVGEVTNIAPTEDIRSARFDADRAFLVTFKKTDPLFAIDLSDPTAPRVAGELKIPGFSTYMHMLDNDHLLAIGYDAADQGGFAWFQGVLLQVFDVTDMKSPTLSAKHVIGTRGSSSEALGNHLAFNYFAPKKLLAVPMAVCDGVSGNSTYGSLSFGGLMVFDITPTSIGYRGGVPHATPGNSTATTDVCTGWWTNPTSQVKRSIFMDDYVFSIATDLVRVSSLASLGTPITSLPLE